jgi:fatty acid desaturase
VCALTDVLPRPELTKTRLKTLVADELRAGLSRRGVEWPTVGLAIVIYSGWLAVTWFYGTLPLWIFLPLAALLVTWQSSLQHEVLHGHPTQSRRFNRLLAMPPLVIWLPYERYRQTHLTHHIDERLTDPIDDPESRYLTHEAWADLGPLMRSLVRSQATLLGRITIGPYLSLVHFAIDEYRRVRDNAPMARSVWTEHLIWLGLVMIWVTLVCHIPLWIYFFGVAMPGTGLMMIRSFCEHRAVEDQEERTAVVENAWFFGPLFLFNNLHVVHHEAPMMPWYKIPGWYRQNRDAVIRANGGLVYNSYFDVARRYLITPHHASVHPMDRIPRS